MPDNDLPPRFQRPVRIGLWLVAATLFLLGLLAALPGAWALPHQAPDYQTVPTRTPTPTPRQSGPTRTPTRSSQPTATPVPAQPTATLLPNQPTATPLPSQPALGVSPAAGAAVWPVDCWAVPTPGFSAQPADGVAFRIAGGRPLVEPGRVVPLQLLVDNSGDQAIRNLLLCSPLDPALVATNPTASQGRVQLESQGLVVELGDLAPGTTARISVDLGIPEDYPLGGVIESQAWLFFEGQQASTELWTWALPPAWLPPTGE